MKKVKCFVCKEEKDCEEGSNMERLGFCGRCLIFGAVTWVNSQGNKVLTPDDRISQENQREMVKRIEEDMKKKN